MAKYVGENKSMAIYIQSRGINQDRDYRWLRIKSNQYYPENPDFLLQSIDNLVARPIDLIESQKSSIILVARRNDYCLLVTGLKARPERTDFAGRSIRNSVVWICQKEQENIIRSLLIRALQGKLEPEIDATISNGGEYGFEVDYQSLVELFNSALNLENNQNTDLSCKIGSNSESLRQEIALELQANPLPDRSGLLVLVTSIKSAAALKETTVWRGLSSRIDAEKLAEYSFGKTVNQQTQKKTIFWGLAIAIILIMAIALMTIPEKSEPETIPTPSTIQQSLSTTSPKKLNRSVNLSNIKQTNY